VAGCQHLARDPRFSTNSKRVENRGAITALLAEMFARRTTKEWCDALEAAGVPNGPINNLKQVFEEPQVAARGMKIELEHAAAGRVPLIASPMKFSGTPLEHKAAPPTLGQHTDEVLSGVLKLDPAAIARLRADGVI
jgi:crotonobetainyl-CoA:carnitine CoA-transferase CaiB-like acyl-CoA transferase